MTVEGKSPVDITPGQVVSLPGGAKHTFTNTAEVTATIVGLRSSFPIHSVALKPP